MDSGLFWDIMSLQRSRSLDGIERLSRNVGKNDHSTLRNIHVISRSQSTLQFHCKAKVLLVHATKEYGGLGAKLHSFLTSALYAGECPTLGSAPPGPQERAGMPAE